MRFTAIVLCLLSSAPALAEAPKPVGTSGGRFQLIQLSSARRDQYMIDTQTGRLWTPTCFNFEGEQCAAMAWAEEKVIGLNTSAAAVNKEATKGK